MYLHITPSFNIDRLCKTASVLLFLVIIYIIKHVLKISRKNIMPLADCQFCLWQLSCRAKWQKCATDIETLKWTPFIQFNFWQKKFRTKTHDKLTEQLPPRFPKLVNYILWQMCENILTCKRVVCARQLGVNLQFKLRIKIDFECWHYELQTQIFDSKYRKIRMFQFNSTNKF